VGLVTGGCLAGIGHEVICTDNDASKIKVLEDGGLPIYEPGLEKVIDSARKEKRLRFSANPADAATQGDAIFICVGTPPLPDGDADLSAIDHVARTIASHATSPKLVIEKSTVPARNGRRVTTRFGRLRTEEQRKISRCFQSGVPPRGHSRRRLLASRPRGRWHRGRNSGKAAKGNLPPGVGAKVQNAPYTPRRPVLTALRRLGW